MHPQRKPVELVGWVDVERLAKVDRCVLAEHRTFHVGLDQIRIETLGRSAFEDRQIIVDPVAAAPTGPRHADLIDRSADIGRRERLAGRENIGRIVAVGDRYVDVPIAPIGRDLDFELVQHAGGRSEADVLVRRDVGIVVAAEAKSPAAIARVKHDLGVADYQSHVEAADAAAEASHSRVEAKPAVGHVGCYGSRVGHAAEVLYVQHPTGYKGRVVAIQHGRPLRIGATGKGRRGRVERLGKLRPRLIADPRYRRRCAAEGRVVEADFGPVGSPRIVAIRRNPIANRITRGHESFDVLSQTVGNIGELLRIEVVRMGDGSARFDQRQVFAVAVELEVRVQLGIRIGAVVTRGKHQHVTTRLHGNVGKGPASEIRCVVGQVPSVEVQRPSGRVVDLDPIRGVAVLVSQRAVVARHQLADHRPDGQQGSLLQRFEAKRPAPRVSAGGLGPIVQESSSSGHSVSDSLMHCGSLAADSQFFYCARKRAALPIIVLGSRWRPQEKPPPSIRGVGVEEKRG